MEFIRPKKSQMSLDMAPLIDVVFQLLIFFMLTSSFANPVLQLKLPKAEKFDAKESRRIVVSVDRAGTLFINSVQTSLERLKGELAFKLAGDSRKAVDIQGDAGMAYGLFVQIMDLARQAGARQVNIAHETGGKA